MRLTTALVVALLLSVAVLGAQARSQYPRPRHNAEADDDEQQMAVAQEAHNMADDGEQQQQAVSQDDQQQQQDQQADDGVQYDQEGEQQQQSFQQDDENFRFAQTRKSGRFLGDLWNKAKEIGGKVITNVKEAAKDSLQQGWQNVQKAAKCAINPNAAECKPPAPAPAPAPPAPVPPRPRPVIRPPPMVLPRRPPPKPVIHARGPDPRDRPLTASDIEDCVACRYVWLQVELQVGNSQIEENVYDAFTSACIEAQKAPIFYAACDDMFDDVYGMIGDYMEGYTVNQVCEGAKMCR